MKIESLHIENIRCFESLTILFDKLHENTSLLVTGDNGDGKSTILRCIAMGLCDQASFSALLRELPGEFIRKSSNNGKITIDLVEGNNKYRIKTKLESLKSFEGVTQTL